MSPPRQDVLAHEGLLGGTNYEAVPAGTADDVVASHKRAARKWMLWRMVGVLVSAVIVTAVVFRLLEDLRVAGGLGIVIAVVGVPMQLKARNQGVPEVVDRDIDPDEARREYGVDPAEAPDDDG